MSTLDFDSLTPDALELRRRMQAAITCKHSYDYHSQIALLYDCYSMTKQDPFIELHSIKRYAQTLQLMSGFLQDAFNPVLRTYGTLYRGMYWTVPELPEVYNFLTEHQPIGKTVFYPRFYSASQQRKVAMKYLLQHALYWRSTEGIAALLSIRNAWGAPMSAFVPDPDNEIVMEPQKFIIESIRAEKNVHELIKTLYLVEMRAYPRWWQ